MFCSNCGTQVPDGTVFCPNCGAKLEQTTQQTTSQQPAQQPTPQPQQAAPQQIQLVYQPPVQEERQSNGLAVVGFIFAFIFPPLGFFFSCLGLGKSNKTHSGRGLAVTGIVLSVIFMIVWAIVIIAATAGINFLINS